MIAAIIDYINLLKEEELCINTKKTKQIKQTKPQIFQKLNKTPQTNKPKKSQKQKQNFFLSAPNIYMFEISTYIGI